MGEISARLAAAGVASLRYDKRGSVRSGGNYRSAGFNDNVDDARRRSTHSEPDRGRQADRVVVIGHSEGALIRFGPCRR